MWKAILAIAVGSSFGALLRWVLGMSLNSVLPQLPPGTLVANLIGAYVIGVALAVFTDMPGIAPEWRLLVITGFCGGLTTFSTFSAEVVGLMQSGRLSWAFATIAVHVMGSLAMTFLGMASWQWLRLR